jgi:hypothetical protein
MRYSASEKYEIIRLVEQSSLSVGPVPTQLCKTARFQCHFAILLFFTGPMVATPPSK